MIDKIDIEALCDRLNDAADTAFKILPGKHLKKKWVAILKARDALRQQQAEIEELRAQIKKLGAVIPVNTGGTFENDPPDAIIDVAIRWIEELRE